MFGRELTFTVIAFILVVPATVFLSVSIFVSDVFAAAPAKGYLNASPGNCTGPDNILTTKGWLTCCWTENEFGQDVKKCQSCKCPSSGSCSQSNLECRGVVTPITLPEGDLPQAEIVPPIRTLPDTSDLPTLQTVPGPDLNQGTEGEPTLPVVCSEEAGLEKDPETGQCVPIEPGAGGGGMPTLEQVPQNRALPGGELPTLQPGPGLTQGTEGEPPLPVICSEEAGLELDEETGLCVPIESPVTEQPEETTEEPEEQSSSDGGEEQSGGEEDQPSEESDSELNGNN